MSAEDGRSRAGRGRRWMLVAAGALAAGGALTACSSNSSASNTTTAPPPVTVHLATVVMDGGMVNHSGWPMYQPSDMTVPKGATVDMTIYSYDTGTAPLPANMAIYTKAAGVTDLTEGGQPVTTVAASDVAHTFTVPQLGINVPFGVAPTAAANSEQKPLVVTFTFTASKSGTFTWKCMAPCGSGSDGMGGPMATMGYMEGTLTVA
ncbi:MAG: hypothetical protein M0007_14475 [Actinomycetota bacterium]|nr:hypothetical protein [Actinomycetota bacterium]